VAVADGRIDPEEMIEVLNQVQNVLEYSSGFTYEIFRDHVTNVMKKSPEFRNIAEKDPFEGLKTVAELLGRIEYSEAQHFKKYYYKWR